MGSPPSPAHGLCLPSTGRPLPPALRGLTVLVQGLPGLGGRGVEVGGFLGSGAGGAPANAEAAGLCGAASRAPRRRSRGGGTEKPVRGPQRSAGFGGPHSCGGGGLGPSCEGPWGVLCLRPPTGSQWREDTPRGPIGARRWGGRERGGRLAVPTPLGSAAPTGNANGLPFGGTMTRRRGCRQLGRPRTEGSGTRWPRDPELLAKGTNVTGDCLTRRTEAGEKRGGRTDGRNSPHRSQERPRYGRQSPGRPVLGGRPDERSCRRTSQRALGDRFFRAISADRRRGTSPGHVSGRTASCKANKGA